jgi:hypothetical protein
MKLDASDIHDLQPLIEAAVHATLDAARANDAKLDAKRLAFPEGEAAAMLGVRRHVLRDARLRGELAAVKLGKGYVFGRDELLRFLREGARR